MLAQRPYATLGARLVDPGCLQISTAALARWVDGDAAAAPQEKTSGAIAAPPPLSAR